MMLLKLVSTSKAEARHSVVSLGSAGTIGDRLVRHGVEVHALGLNASWTSFVGIRKLQQVLRTLSPNLVQGWMYHANVAAAGATVLGRNSWALNWSVRCTLDPFGSEKLLSRIVARMGATLSRVPYAIIYNSARSRQQHEALGYRADRSMVIANGFDTGSFSPDQSVRRATRTALGVQQDELLIGQIARLDPMKDHLNFIRAAYRVSQRVDRAKFILAGKGVPSLQRDDTEARSILAQLGKRVILLDEQTNVADLLRALDVSVLSSAYGEGFPNVIGESMACGVPCVTTDVGDSAAIVGASGYVVPPRRPDALAAGIEDLLLKAEGERRELGAQARRRVEDLFSMDLCKRQFVEAWRSSVLNFTESRGTR